MLKVVQQRGLLAFPKSSILPKRSCSKSLNNDELVLKKFVNRNPRSMELLRIAMKPYGYCLDYPSNHYYYRLNFDKKVKNLTGWVNHNNGRKVVSASTKEWIIRRHLYSAIDGSAAENLGRVLSRRCLQAGIYEVHTDLTEFAESSARVNIFLEAMKEGGISIGEAPQIRTKDTYSFMLQKPTYPWEVSEEEVDSLDANDKSTKKNSS